MSQKRSRPKAIPKMSTEERVANRNGLSGWADESIPDLMIDRTLKESKYNGDFQELKEFLGIRVGRYRAAIAANDSALAAAEESKFIATTMDVLQEAISRLDSLPSNSHARVSEAFRNSGRGEFFDFRTGLKSDLNTFFNLLAIADRAIDGEKGGSGRKPKTARNGFIQDLHGWIMRHDTEMKKGAATDLVTNICIALKIEVPKDDHGADEVGRIVRKKKSIAKNSC